MTIAKILIAVREEPLTAVVEALSGYELMIVKDIEQATELLLENGTIDLFLIGILFDDSRAMELIKLIRLDKNNHNTPILVVRLMPSQYAEMLEQVMKTMIALDTVSSYFEHDYLRPEMGLALRKAVEDCLRREKHQVEPKTTRKRPVR